MAQKLLCLSGLSRCNCGCHDAHSCKPEVLDDLTRKRFCLLNIMCDSSAQLARVAGSLGSSFYVDSVFIYVYVYTSDQSGFQGSKRGQHC